MSTDARQPRALPDKLARGFAILMWLAEAAADSYFQRPGVPGHPAVAPGGRGSTGPWVVLSGVGRFGAGQPGARACGQVTAAVIWMAQGQVAAMRSRVRQPPRARRPAAENRRSRRRLGSHARAEPSRASIASRRSARRPRPPARTRSGSGRSRAAAGRASRCLRQRGCGPSQRARRRWSSSRSASWPVLASVAK
jgi:hypothetical protein